MPHVLTFLMIRLVGAFGVGVGEAGGVRNLPAQSMNAAGSIG